MPYTQPFSYVDYEITPSMISNPTFSFGTVSTLPNASVPTASQLEVYLDGVLLDSSLWSLTGSSVVVFASMTVGQTLRIQRYVPKESRLVDFQGGAVIDEADLDLDGLQSILVAQEAYDESQKGLRKGPDGQSWDAQGLKIINGRPAENDTDYATLGQVTAVLNGEVVAEPTDVSSWIFTGDGSTTQFPLTGANLPAGSMPAIVFVAIDGVVQTPGSSQAYTLEDNVLTFTAPPAVGSEISARVIVGNIRTRLAPGQIAGDSFSDRSISTIKLVGPVGSGSRFLAVAPNGDISAAPVVASNISDFDARVRTSRITDLAAPTSALNMANQVIYALGSPGSPDHAANKAYVDAQISSLESRVPTIVGSGSSSSSFYGTITTVRENVAGGWTSTNVGNFSPGWRPRRVSLRISNLRLRRASQSASTVSGFITDSTVSALFLPNSGTRLLMGTYPNVGFETVSVFCRVTSQGVWVEVENNSGDPFAVSSANSGFIDGYLEQ